MLFGSKKILYFPGCYSKYKLRDIATNYTRILKKLGINFDIAAEEACCGAPLLDSGYSKEFQEIKMKNLEIINSKDVDKIITNCPSCYRVLSKVYGLKVEHITQTLARFLKRLPVKYEEEITYFDPCNLGRKSGIYEEPRLILESLGFDVKEFEENRANGLCCGAGGGLKRNLPGLANKIAKDVLRKVKTKKLVTCCPLCYLHLKENAKNVEVLELSQVI